MTRIKFLPRRGSATFGPARRVFLIPLLLALAGCKTDFHLVQADTSTSADAAVTFTVESDMDLEASKWKDHMLQFRFMVVRGGDCLTGGMLEQAKQAHEADLRQVGTIFDIRDVPHERRAILIKENGAVEPLGITAPGRWRYRIRIPLAILQDYSGRALEQGSSYWLVGRMVVIKYMLIPWAESDFLTSRLPTPHK